MNIPLTFLFKNASHAYIMDQECVHHKCEECGSINSVDTRKLLEACGQMIGVLAQMNDIDIQSVEEYAKKIYDESIDNLKQAYEETKIRCDDCTSDAQCEKCSKCEQDELTRNTHAHMFDIDVCIKGK